MGLKWLIIINTIEDNNLYGQGYNKDNWNLGKKTKIINEYTKKRKLIKWEVEEKCGKYDYRTFKR